MFSGNKKLEKKKFSFPRPKIEFKFSSTIQISPVFGSFTKVPFLEIPMSNFPISPDSV